MTMTATDIKSSDDVLDAVGRLAPEITPRASEIEAARRLPPDLLDALIGAGAFRILLPDTHGGFGGDVQGALRVLEALAEADASVGWTVMIGAGAWRDLVNLPRATFDELFASGGSVIIAGALNPSGTLTAVDGGYRVTGRWGFASGCEHATWLFGNCVEQGEDGAPGLRGAVFSPSQVVIEDTWTVSGMCGTGSHHFNVTDVTVAGDRTFSLLDEQPCLDAPIIRIPPPALFSLLIAGVAVGIAQGAVTDILALAHQKVPLFADSPLATNPMFQADLATADTDLRAARALLRETAESTWATAVDGDQFTLEQRAQNRAAAVWATARATEVVQMAYRSGGGSSIYAASPLQRRLRDINALTQHFAVKRDTLTTAGAVLAGQEISIPVF